MHPSLKPLVAAIAASDLYIPIRMVSGWAELRHRIMNGVALWELRVCVPYRFPVQLEDWETTYHFSEREAEIASRRHGYPVPIARIDPDPKLPRRPRAA